MGFDVVFCTDKGWAGAEILFHNAEVFFDLPTLPVDPDDLTYLSL